MNAPSEGVDVRIDAVIVGAQRSGTTSLASVLAMHPRVCLAVNKEAHLFDDHDVQLRGLNANDIASSFPTHQEGQIRLDATPSYLYLPGCLEALRRHNPNARVIVVLRDPAHRAISHWHHSKWLEQESLPLLAALAVESRRLGKDRDPLSMNSAHRLWSYIDRGRYERQLLHVLRMWPDALVLSFGEVLRDPVTQIERVEAFLGIESHPSEEPFPRLNGHHARRSRKLTAAFLRLMLRQDMRATCQLLNWHPSALIEAG